ncbi:MAG TPA: DUF6391 domain-containing protein, partial [Ardenticatenaceae bacterium]|nr:DUF6391 domain-containing protein [Ardenticatenaceae bacterium]
APHRGATTLKQPQRIRAGGWQNLPGPVQFTRFGSPEACVFLFLAVILLILFPLLLAVLLPIGFGIQSLASLFTLPVQVCAVARDRRRRRNHALEHATVNVLEQRYGARIRLGGLAERDGFWIAGVAAQPEVILSAAREGLSRLKAGEWRLALHPRCGTTLVGAQLIAALTFLGLVLLSRQLSIVWVLVALVAAAWLARPVGMLMQRHLTTSTDVEAMHVDDVVWEQPRTLLGLVLGGGRPTRFRVRTHELAARPVVERAASPATRRYRAY